MKKFTLVLAFILFALTVACQAAEAEKSFTSKAGTNSVATFLAEWKDAARNRAVPVKIYFPKQGDGPFPVIIFSHGLGASRDTYEYLGRHWASNGYVSVHVQHKGSDSSILLQGKTAPPLNILKAATNVENSINRPKDISFVINQLERLQKEDGFPLKGKLDLKRLGVAGHSYGAWTTLAIAGEKPQLMNGKQIPFQDPRVKAIIPMSAPMPIAKQAKLSENAFANVKIPVMHMTGTLDDSPVGETKAAERRIPFDKIEGVDQYLITFEGGDHMIFSGRWMLPGGNREKDAEFQKLICLASTAFWDAYLKDDAPAKKFLQDGDLEKALGANAKLEEKKAKAASRK